MTRDRRKKTRRGSDRLLDEIITFLAGLDEVMDGETVELKGQVERIKEAAGSLGRRDEDRLRAQQLVSISETLLKKIERPPSKEGQPRKVQIQKVGGKDATRIPVGEVRVGWEAEPPEVGKRYTVYMDDGSIYKTGRVIRVGKDGFHTTHSSYRLKVLEVKKA